MKIKLSSIYATADRTAQPGETIDVPDAEGQSLIDGRYATAVKEEAASAKPAAPAADAPADDAPPAEDASTAAPENAASQRRGGRRGAKPAAPAADAPAT